MNKKKIKTKKKTEADEAIYDQIKKHQKDDKLFDVDIEKEIQAIEMSDSSDIDGDDVDEI